MALMSPSFPLELRPKIAEGLAEVQGRIAEIATRWSELLTGPPIFSPFLHHLLAALTASPPPLEVPFHPFEPSRPADIQSLIIQFAKRHGVDPELMLALAEAESGFDPKAVSRSGAVGVFQLMPETAKALGVKDPFNPAQNIDAGIRYFRKLLDEFQGQITLALAAYNAGPQNVRRYGGIPPFPETRTFVRRVLTLWTKTPKTLSPPDPHQKETEERPHALNSPSQNDPATPPLPFIRKGKETALPLPLKTTHPDPSGPQISEASRRIPFRQGGDWVRVKVDIPTVKGTVGVQFRFLFRPSSLPPTLHLSLRLPEGITMPLFHAALPSLEFRLWSHGLSLAQISVIGEATLKEHRNDGKERPSRPHFPSMKGVLV